MRFLLALFVAVAFFATGEALECWKCLGQQSGCEEFDESASGVTKTTCLGTSNTCVKGVEEYSNGTSIALRDCLSSLLNYQKSFDRATVSLVSVSVYFCDSNLCNGASTTSAALSMLMLLALPFVFRSH